MRTIGVNALFAQTIYTCFAKSYRAGYFAIVTSINKDDYLPGGKSYFLSEAEAILAMLNNRTEKAASLCIIDEIFAVPTLWSASRLPLQCCASQNKDL